MNKRQRKKFWRATLKEQGKMWRDLVVFGNAFGRFYRGRLRRIDPREAIKNPAMFRRGCMD